jgi:BirA family biotin operon repressor/biotin-[acetyl-CoA-carboxylase] ligase
MIDPGRGLAPVPLFLHGPGSSALDVGWRLAEQGRLPPFGSLLLESQTAGRGRAGRLWVSPAGHVYGALRLPPGPPFDSPGAALGLAWFLAEALGDFGWPLAIKWPNDLLYAGGKAAGILLEARRGLLLAGVGLNLQAPPPEVERRPGQPPASALPGAPPPRTLWPELVKKIILLYNGKVEPWTMAELAAAAEKRLWRFRRRIQVLRPAAEPPAAADRLTGVLAGLGPDGQLLLDDGGGGLRRIWSGTVMNLDMEKDEPEN